MQLQTNNLTDIIKKIDVTYQEISPLEATFIHLKKRANIRRTNMKYFNYKFTH